MKEEVSIADNVLAKLKRDFEEVMEALQGEAGLEYFQAEYERIYNALTKSHTSEKVLIEECQRLTQELLGNAAKMQAAVKLSQGDHSMIEALKREIEKAWGVVDSANAKDLRARETVNSLRQEIASLQSLIEEGTALTSDHSANLDQLKLETKRLQTECEEMSKRNVKYTKSVTELRGQIKEAEDNLHNYQEELERLEDHYKLTNQEYVRERGARERAEYQCKELLVVLRTRENELREVQEREKKLEETITKLQSETQAAVEKRQVLEKKLETADRQLFHTQQSYNDSVDTTMELNERLQGMNRAIGELDRRILEAEAERERVQRVKDRDVREVRRLVQQNDNVQREQKNLSYQHTQVQRQIASLVKEQENYTRAEVLFRRECEEIEHKAEAELGKQQVIQASLQVEMANQQELEGFIQAQRGIEAGLQQTLAQFEKETVQCVEEASQVAMDHRSTEDELLTAKAAVAETRKLIEDSEAKLSKQQSSYEQVRAERNQFTKRLVEAQDEIVELKQRFKMMDHQLLQLREELAIKARKNEAEGLAHKKIQERMGKAKKQVDERLGDFHATKAKAVSIGLQIKQFVKIVSRCDQELSARQQELLKATHHRDILATQLVRRNDEVALLNEKLRLQHEALVHGEAAYRERLADLRLLRFKLTEVNRQAHLASSRARELREARAALRQVQEALELENTKAAALAEEIEDPYRNKKNLKPVRKTPPPLAPRSSSFSGPAASSPGRGGGGGGRRPEPGGAPGEAAPAPAAPHREVGGLPREGAPARGEGAAGRGAAEHPGEPARAGDGAPPECPATRPAEEGDDDAGAGLGAEYDHHPHHGAAVRGGPAAARAA